MSTMRDSGELAEAATRRAALVEALKQAGRAQSAATVMFHTALSARQGLSATEEKALDLLDRFGPMTAGDLSQRSGLAPASVTGLVDRLERKGFVRRVPHAQDKRRVVIEIIPGSLAGVSPLFADWERSLEELLTRFSDEQLATILDFLLEATRRQNEATTKLTEP